MSGRHVLDTNVIWYSLLDHQFADRIVRSYPVQLFSAVVIGELATHADRVGAMRVRLAPDEKA